MAGVGEHQGYAENTSRCGSTGQRRQMTQRMAPTTSEPGSLGTRFVGLCSSVWATGTIPQQMCWVVMVLIPKGQGGVSGHWAPQTDLEGPGAGNRYSVGEHQPPRQQQPQWVPCRARHGYRNHRGKTCPGARTFGASAILWRLRWSKESV